MAELYGEMTVKLTIDPEMTEAGKAMLRQMIRQELEKALRGAVTQERMRGYPATIQRRRA